MSVRIYLTYTTMYSVITLILWVSTLSLIPDIGRVTISIASAVLFFYAPIVLGPLIPDDQHLVFAYMLAYHLPLLSLGTTLRQSQPEVLSYIDGFGPVTDITLSTIV